MKKIIIGCIFIVILALLTLSLLPRQERDDSIPKRLHDVKILTAAFAEIYHVDSTNITIQMLLEELKKKDKKLYYPVINKYGKDRYKIVYPHKTIKYANDNNKVVIEDNDNDRDVVISMESGIGLLLKRDEYEKMLVDSADSHGT